MSLHRSEFWLVDSQLNHFLKCKISEIGLLKSATVIIFQFSINIFLENKISKCRVGFEESKVIFRFFINNFSENWIFEENYDKLSVFH